MVVVRNLREEDNKNSEGEDDNVNFEDKDKILTKSGRQ